MPGYQGYKKAADKAVPLTSVLVMEAGLWRQGYLIEHDVVGNSVIFLPDTPNTDHGHVVLASKNHIHVLSSLRPDQLGATLKNLGKGLLSESETRRMV